MPMCKTVDHCYEGGSKTVVDRYHSGNNLGTGPVLFQYCNVYWVVILTFLCLQYRGGQYEKACSTVTQSMYDEWNRVQGCICL